MQLALVVTTVAVVKQWVIAEVIVLVMGPD